MYFFLSILSLDDICFISTIVPNMTVDIQTHSTVISFMVCLTQMSLFTIFACMNDMLLTAMAYNQFVSICRPLNYPVIMSSPLYGFLVLISLCLAFGLTGTYLLPYSFCTAWMWKLVISSVTLLNSLI
jgi:olfactory receptor